MNQVFWKKMEQESDQDKKMELAKDFVDTATEPSFVLNMDDNLSVYYANSEFYDTFGTDYDSFCNLYHNAFRYTLTIHHQISQWNTMHAVFGKKDQYGSAVEVITASGCMKELYFYVKRNKMGEAGEKLLGYFITPKEGVLLPQH